MKNYTLLFFLGLCGTTLQAQQQVVATSGNVVQYASGSISWTLGETVTTTLAFNNKVLNQGFQQSYGELKAVNLDSDLKIYVWPNPTEDWVTLSVENPGQLVFRIFDIHGKLLRTNPLKDKITQIDFSGFASGAYQIKLVAGESELKTITVIKQ